MLPTSCAVFSNLDRRQSKIKTEQCVRLVSQQFLNLLPISKRQKPDSIQLLVSNSFIDYVRLSPTVGRRQSSKNLCIILDVSEKHSVSCNCLKINRLLTACTQNQLACITLCDGHCATFHCHQLIIIIITIRSINVIN